MENIKRFENQVAIITGGASGLGKAAAQRLLSEGARVVLLDIDEEVLEKTADQLSDYGIKPLYQYCDISEESSVQKAFSFAYNKFNRIDIMINSAGVVGPSNVKIKDVSIEGFDKVQAVNLRGSFLACREAIKYMEPADYGRILLIASIAGKEGNAGMVCYSTSKAGVIGLVKSVGKEYAETGITINGLAPAVIRTVMVDSMPEEQVKYMTDKIPAKRCGTLEEVASIICWIVSTEASFNTGFTFDLTGGRSVY
ncbi:MAG: SDR family NAD(P)-dependent oxidoreductase [Bacteroidetes bacterium]|nr:SDR family NAD(P)-dependent oxidoreductase [Bacteroidota bacterium]MDA1121851.1 SDR family NAD(P)-dependent oxidoreductase [Bacteroidota bacterium]